jgi:7-carboxy-7-deazaguanine synthase
MSVAVNLTEKREPFFNVNEIFGPTIQGEGPHTGQQVSFFRVAGCNLSCVWCDTPYSWDWERFDRNEESHKTTVTDVAEALTQLGATRIVMTGGEPMGQQKNIPLLYELTGMKIDVETNGTIMPKDETIEAVDLFCVSPKLAHAGDPENLRLKPEVLAKFAELSRLGKAFFKFVAEKEEDFEEIETFIKAGDIPQEAVWIMPEGFTAERHLANLRKLADKVIERGWNLTSRIHVLIWDTERGH